MVFCTFDTKNLVRKPYQLLQYALRLKLHRSIYMNLNISSFAVTIEKILPKKVPSCANYVVYGDCVLKKKLERLAMECFAGLHEE